MEYLNKQHRRKVRACGFNCGYCVGVFRSMCQHCWSVRVGCPPLGHTETAQCSVGPVALSSFTVKIHVKFSQQLLQYHGLTASLWLVQCCNLY
jgi:hypothetical protein